MEKVVNKTCNIAIDNDYKNFESILSNSDINSIYDKVLIISDQNVYSKQGTNFISVLKAKSIYEYIVIPGEESKSLQVYEKVMQFCLKINLSRKSLIIALGGGVVGDLAGFVASTYMRGIDIIQVPTSLLAQVDSSIGGKCGINLGKIKNIIGSFYQPKLTYINVKALETLPEEEFIGGMAEVIKYGLIYDYDFLNYLIENSEDIISRCNENLYYIVNKCANIKAKIVDKDEKEGDLRKILNFGHTFGHGVEKLCGISHGYAVSIGMNMAFKLSLSKELIKNDYYQKFLTVCKKYKLPLDFKLPLDKESLYSNKNIEEEILKLMKSDKKNSFGAINLILPVDLGKVGLVDNIDDNELLNIIRGCNNA